MTNRREFLRTSVAVSALPLTMHELVSPATAMPAAQGAVLVRKAIVDDRYAEARIFAHELGRHRVPAEALDDGDVTRAYEHLDLCWRSERFAVGGMTQFGPMLVVEQLARDRDLRVALRIAHASLPDGTLAHRITAAPETVALAEELLRRRTDWPALAAALVARSGACAAEPATRMLATHGAPPVLAVSTSAAPRESIIHYYTPHAISEGAPLPLDGPLFTWVVTQR
jgi:hypothetical protein